MVFKDPSPVEVDHRFCAYLEIEEKEKLVSLLLQTVELFKSSGKVPLKRIGIRRTVTVSGSSVEITLTIWVENGWPNWKLTLILKLGKIKLKMFIKRTNPLKPYGGVGGKQFCKEFHFPPPSKKWG